MLYGSNAFEIDIKYDYIKFRYTWLTTMGLKPKSLYQFPDHFTQRNIRRIRNYVINVEHVDSYQGMIKYNCQNGASLTAGVMNQVRKFVNEVQDVETFGRVLVRLSEGNKVLSDIRRVKVHCIERGRNSALAQTVLSPFRHMKGCNRAEVSGSVTAEYAADIERAMVSIDASIEPMAPIKTEQEDPAVLWRWKNSWNA